MEIRIFEIDDKLKKTRVDKAVASLIDVSRKRAADLIDQGHVKVNGKVPKSSYSLQAKDKLEVEIPPLEELEILPQNIPLDVVYEDEDVIVINKPKGMVVHPAPGHTDDTLVNALMYHCKDLSGINGVVRPGIVHRIDKDTSGLLVACKNDFAHESISKQLKNKECTREYKALVHYPFSHEYGTINAPIGRDDKDRQKMKVTNRNAKEAVTHFTVLKNYKDYALLNCKLETGRTHQIRVHMQYIEHPIVGDPKYGKRKTMDTNGQLLHAYALEFTHPRTGKRMRFEADLDPIFKEVLERLDKEEE